MIISKTAWLQRTFSDQINVPVVEFDQISDF